MTGYNILSNLNANAGRNKWSVGLGTTRNIKGSSNRIYAYCRRHSETPLYCMFQFTPPPPPPPVIPCTQGFVTYSFDYTGIDPLTETLILNHLPIIILPGIFTISRKPLVIIAGNNVFVEIRTCLYEHGSYLSDFGISFNNHATFYNDNTVNLTMLNTNKCPFSRTGYQFSTLNDITILPAFNPYFLPDTSLLACFYYCPNFNSDISAWNTKNVTIMDYMFSNATTFNQPIGNWDTKNVTSMQFIFENASSFDKDIGLWDVTNVENFYFAFSLATSFNNGGSNLIKLWTAPKCSSFSYMFNGCTTFNQPLANLVDTSGVSGCYMDNMFNGATSFDQDIGNWKVNNVVTMDNMFIGATAFNNGSNSSINYWTAPKCYSFNSMFNGCITFNQPLTNLVDTSGVVDCAMNYMFNGATSFDQDIGNWKVNNVTSMYHMFVGATAFNNGGSNSINSWTAPNCTSFISMFQSATSFNQPVSNLVDTSGVVDCAMDSMFRQATIFNQNLGNWNVINASSMGQMFFLATAFNNGGSTSINSWTAPNCVTFTSMFQSATSFNQPIPNLVNTLSVSSCTTDSMFRSATLFNQNIGNWKVNNVTTMANMFLLATTFNNGGSNSIQSWTAPKCRSFLSTFSGATAFNQPLPILVDTSAISIGCSMANMFLNVTNFNQNIGGWNTDNVTAMSSMFQNVIAFNQNIGLWNVSRVITMASMFQGATAFNNGNNTSIQNWYAPICISFTSMFNGATAFNQPLTNLVNTLVVSGCTMNSMFQNAISFNQNIGGWKVNNVTTMTGMFQGATIFNNGGNNLISSWTAPKCTSYTAMFQSDTSFNQPLTNLVDTSGVGGCVMNSMFQNATSFNQNIGSWNVINVTAMNSMFLNQTATQSVFNNGGSNTINTWYAPKCTSYVSMFQGAVAFNQPLPILVDTSSVAICSMASMFQTATIFNQPIGNWNTIHATSMASMFQGASAFNQNIGNWNTSNVTSMANMFVGFTNITTTTKFNNGQASGTTPGTAPLNWNTSKVTTMNSMFRYCIGFNQNITTSGSNWNTNLVTDVSGMFQGINNTTGIHLFNNSQAVGGITAPMGWVFTTVPASGNYRLNCNLTTANKPTQLT
uniref:BspA family leucine-rich repeat surface protein n=1 Tax=viral metagenome TaxID=1070528 RepID=A0A6C0ISV3_9ZZZZ